MVKMRFMATVATILFVGIAGWVVSMLARGYRLDFKKFDIRPTGLLVVTSEPDGAQILVNGELESATNATISLAPNTYDVEVRKDGFVPWRKRLTIKKEEVTQVDTVLFPVAPSLSALTFTGAISPVLSPDGTKIVYGVPGGQKKTGGEKSGLWSMELGDLPLGFSREPRHVTNVDIGNARWVWSPDSRELLLYSSQGTYLIDAGVMTAQSELVNIEGKRLEAVYDRWEEQEEEKYDSSFSRLPKEIEEILREEGARVVFSPDGNKVLYTAPYSTQIPEGLIAPLPGSSTQEEERNIQKGSTYVYDIKEDRNFLITDIEPIAPQSASQEERVFRTSALSLSSTSTLSWFPTSNHVIMAEDGKITIMDYDGTNRQVVWSGPYEAPYAIPFPNTTRLLILTGLGSTNGNGANLYALSLK